MTTNYRNDIKNARKCENINDPIDTYVVDYIAMAFSKMFIKLHIIPNVITFMSGIIGVAGGCLAGVVVFTAACHGAQQQGNHC